MELSFSVFHKLETEDVTELKMDEAMFEDVEEDDEEVDEEVVFDIFISFLVCIY